MGASIIALVIAGVFLILGMVMLQEVRDADILAANDGGFGCNATSSSNCEAFSGANQTLTGLATFADFWEIIVLAIVISVVIGLLLVVFGRRGAR